MSITCKFGGTSLADAASVRAAIDIVRGNPNRRFIVPSAPGKRTPDDIKITDLLLTWHALAQQGLDAAQPRDLVISRFEELAKELGVDFDVQVLIPDIEESSAKHATPDYMASRGEYINGHLLAAALNATLVDPADCIKFDEEGHLDETTYEMLAKALHGSGQFVVPGYFGSMPDGRVKTFSRGGSDITGAIVARASGSSLYENWTDVSGFRMTDPRIVPDAKRIDELTYRELRELAYMGAQVLHDEAIFPVREPGIHINIRNTNAPEDPGTRIVPSRTPKEPICGIAGRKGFSMINIEKTLMNKERGFGRRVLAVLEQHDISFEHMPTGIDTMSLIISDEELESHRQAVIKSLERTCEPDSINISSGLAIVATVGEGMNHVVGIAARLCRAVSEANINIRVINQGSSENNIIIGVEDSDLDATVQAIYREFEQA
jgi:aspartate kinase